MRRIFSLEELFAELRMDSIPHVFPMVYEEGVALYQQGFPFCEKAVFEAFHQKHALFHKYVAQIDHARQLLAKNDALLLFVCMLSCAAQRFSSDEIYSDLVLPRMEQGVGKPAYDLAPLFALFPLVDKAIENMQERKVPGEILEYALKQYEGILTTMEQRLGYPAYNSLYFCWMLQCIQNSIMRVGRLNFEMRQAFLGRIMAFKDQTGRIRILADKMTAHPSGVGIHYKGLPDTEGAFYCEVLETEEFYEGYPVDERGYIRQEKIKLFKDTWEKFLEHGDPVISVHIPGGGSFDEEEIRGSYEEVKRILRECYPEFTYKAFFCQSWLMDSQLMGMVKEDSNIAKFQKSYVLYPYEYSEYDDVFQFVFKKPCKDYASLPEDTSRSLLYTRLSTYR